jgi:hypothetical protein
VIWFFEKNGQAVRLETRFDNASQEYVIVIDWADRPSETERFGDYGRFHSRIVALEQRLTLEKWTQDGSPTILSDGWRGPIPH